MSGRDWIDEYVACYNVTDNVDLQIERAHAIKAANLPARLYKFRAVNDFALRNLEDGTVWMCSPSKYNDPYDCAVTISARDLTAGRLQLPSTALAQLSTVLSETEINDAMASSDPLGVIAEMTLSRDPNILRDKVPEMVVALRTAYEKVLQPLLQKGIDDVREGMKVCSFCEDCETILMWSHYAQNHTGFCMEYEVPFLSEPVRRMLFPVIYTRTLFDATRFYRDAASGDLTGFNNLYSILQALYKAAEWGYEREWRFVLGFGILDKDQSFPLSLASRVYLGAHISDSDRQKVSEVCAKRKIPMSQMRLAPTEYRMTAEPLS